MRQHDHRTLSRDDVFVGVEEPAQRCLRAEHVEEVRGDEVAEDALALPAEGQAHRPATELHRRQARDAGGVFAQVLERRVRHVVEPGAVVAAADVDHAAGIAHTRGRRQQSVGHRVDGAGRGDAAGERADGGEREDRALAQQAPGVTEIARERHLTLGRTVPGLCSAAEPFTRRERCIVTRRWRAPRSTPQRLGRCRPRRRPAAARSTPAPSASGRRSRPCAP